MAIEYSLSEKNTKFLGRTYRYQDIVWLAYSASGAEFTFHGTECSIELVGDAMATSIGEEIHRARVAIFVNDELVVDVLVQDEKKKYQVFQSEVTKQVTVRIIKLSETTDSTVGIGTVWVEGSAIEKTNERDRKIEFIGDSITCGYGVEEELGGIYSTSNENAMKAYAYQTAKALDVDYSLVSISGYGIISGYTGDGIKNETQRILPYYDKLGMSYGSIASTIPPQTLEWDFSKFIPDIIVINLGTNDASYCGSVKERCREYENGYVEFLKVVRAKNPSSKLICTLGIMGDSLYPYMKKAVDTYRKETKDENIVTMKFDVQLEEDGYAVDSHPSEITHTKAAAKLTDFIHGLLRKEEENYNKTENIDITWIKPDAKLVAITFDDGPVSWANDSTAMKILNTLKEYGQHATFFYIGQNINSENTKEILFAQEIGCEIANHTWSHPDLTTLTQEEILLEVSKSEELLRKVTGRSTNLFRIPYLSCNDTVLSLMNSPCISCSVDSNDWNKATKEIIVDRILAAHNNGTLENSIVLCHETYETTQQAFSEIVPVLLKEGYQLVTVSELAKMNGVELRPGYVYEKLES